MVKFLCQFHCLLLNGEEVFCFYKIIASVFNVF